MFSRVFLPLVKRRCLASMTLAKPHPLLDVITTNRSSFCMWRDPRLKHDGALVSASSVSVSPGVLCQDAPAVFLPNPRKCEIVSHPVMAWKSGNAIDREGPRSEQISWMGIPRSFFPLPKPTNSSNRPSVVKKRMTRITISLSTVLTYRLSGVPVLMHAQHDEISLYLLQSGCMVRGQTHHMVC